MRPFDTRHLPLLAPARAPLSVSVAATTAHGLLVVAQAFALAWLVTTLVTAPGGDGWHRPAAAVAVVVGARALSSWVADAAAARAALRVSAALRSRVLR
ncbi:MAG: hypothetical protein Q8Q02_14040, partial [Nocardioides sp.]|nr:hypothetical protein [Nocardioides sp.]